MRILKHVPFLSLSKYFEKISNAPNYEIESFGNVRLELVFASFVSVCVFSSLGLLQSELLSSRPGWRSNIFPPC